MTLLSSLCDLLGVSLPFAAVLWTGFIGFLVCKLAGPGIFAVCGLAFSIEGLRAFFHLQSSQKCVFTKIEKGVESQS